MSRYLITFDMDTNCLKNNYHVSSYTNAYADIRTILLKHGFDNIQGSVYLGHEGISEAHGTIAIQELTLRLNWFHTCVSNIKFYRLESDLNAQFIADGAFQAKQAFLQRVEQLKQSLVQAGLNQQQIDDVIKQQRFELDGLPLKINV